jgi:SAM-dependent methyltransferase
LPNVYEKLYDGKEYREFSPGESRLPDFFKQVKLAPDDVVIDFGCGTGRAAKSISSKCKVIGLDFAANAVETDIEFHKHDLRKKSPVTGTKGFCTDVLEHIHPRDVRKVLRNIMRAVDECYLQICTVDDDFGKTVGEPLHLTVKPFWWWARMLSAYGLIRYAREERQHAIFVVKKSITLSQLDKKIELTESPDVIKKYIRENLERQWQEAKPFEKQDRVVSILAGGPSLELFDGKGPIITVNGAYNWAIEKGYKPSAQIILDGREFNKRFLDPVVPGCKYLISSGCPPSLFESIPKDQIWMWHSGDWAADVIQEYCKDLQVEKEWFPVFGGSTVMLRAIPLLSMLGLRKMEVYGWDSCLIDGKHHAYSQPENDLEKTIDLIVGGKSFKCHSWMAFQAQEFITLVKHIFPDDLELNVHGDGLIAHILKTGAAYGS